MAFRHQWIFSTCSSAAGSAAGGAAAASGKAKTLSTSCQSHWRSYTGEQLENLLCRKTSFVRNVKDEVVRRFVWFLLTTAVLLFTIFLLGMATKIVFLYNRSHITINIDHYTHIIERNTIVPMSGFYNYINFSNVFVKIKHLFFQEVIQAQTLCCTKSTHK